VFDERIVNRSAAKSADDGQAMRGDFLRDHDSEMRGGRWALAMSSASHTREVVLTPRKRIQIVAVNG
jgi:hypothetical protein